MSGECESRMSQRDVICDRGTRKYDGREKHTLAQEAARRERQEHVEGTDNA